MIEINGHDIAEILSAIDKTNNFVGPTAILAKTVKGKGVSFMEDEVLWHSKTITDEDAQRAYKKSWGSEFEMLATRMAFGQELIEIAKQTIVFICHPDTKSCGLEISGRCFRAFRIFWNRRANLVATAAGIASCE